MEELIKLYNEESLKRKTVEIINIYKTNDLNKLHSLAVKLDINPENYPCAGRLFRKIITGFHPDKITTIHSRIRKLQKEGNTKEMERMRENIRPFNFSFNSEGRISGGSKKTSGYDPARYEYDFEESSYADDYENIFYGDDFEDYIEENEDEYFESSENEEYGFIEAVKNIMYGNMFAEFLPKDLLYLEGSLDLGESDIEDLTGIEYCQNITELNLERNKISQLGGLGELTNLTNLYLAHNQISDLTPLANLKGLKNLDLSFNEIEDISDLYNLPNLEFLNLTGNQILHSPGFEKLAERCMIIF